MNTQKTLIMACKPCHMPGRISEAEYDRWAMGLGPTHWKRQSMRVQYLSADWRLRKGFCWRTLIFNIAWDRGITPPPPLGGSDISRILTKKSGTTLVPGGGVSGGGQQTLPTSAFTLCTATCKKNCDPWGGELNLPHIPQIWHVCLPSRYKCPEPLYICLALGRGAEAPPTGGR